ncbi:hypothetical protein BURPS1710b_1799 [Burkholderia pseudomallei 1710b]|uniref:Uncharacterized protein n=1 Tax=Burkholderia pseudomallei (strain 1710b) TaxID=320372 RepID=Q3JTA3_BURP1|nr:hypothetical protein BURPS1710b_1799 [Burkholderia pseudomallei 1710b]
MRGTVSIPFAAFAAPPRLSAHAWPPSAAPHRLFSPRADERIDAHPARRTAPRPQRQRRRHVASRREPVADRGRRHARRVHGGARHDDRQRRAAAHRRHDVGELRRSDLDAHVVSCRQRHRAADLRLSRPPARPQALLRAVHRRVHDLLVPVRNRNRSRPTDRVPRAAGAVRRRPAAEPAIDHPRYVPARAAQPRVLDLGRGDRRRAGARPDARRLDHRQLLVALGVPAQRADRRADFARGDPARRGSAVETRPRARPVDRLHRHHADRDRPRLSAGDARSRRGRGLVRVDVHPHVRGADRRGARRRDVLAALREKARRRSVVPEGSQFRARLRDDRDVRGRAVRQRRARAATRAAAARLHGDARGSRAVARRAPHHARDSDRQQADAVRADALSRMLRLPAARRVARVLAHARARHRLSEPPEDTQRAIARDRLPVRADHDARVSDRAAPAERRCVRAFHDVPQCRGIDRHFAVDRADSRARAGAHGASVDAPVAAVAELRRYAAAERADDRIALGDAAARRAANGERAVVRDLRVAGDDPRVPRRVRDARDLLLRVHAPHAAFLAREGGGRPGRTLICGAHSRDGGCRSRSARSPRSRARARSGRTFILRAPTCPRNGMT